jgi:hypothetical protein
MLNVSFRKSIFVVLAMLLMLVAGCGGGSSNPVFSNAGPAQQAVVGKAVALDGSGSSVVAGGVIAYQWVMTSRPNGSFAVLTGPQTATPTFTPDVPGTYHFNLVVSDGQGGSAVSTVSVTASTTLISITKSGSGTFVVMGSGLQTVAGVHVVVAYDSSTLINPRVTVGALAAGRLTAAQTTNNPLQIAIVGTTAIGGTGSGNIATIDFDTVSASGAAITSLTGYVIDANGKTVDSQFVNDAGN